MTLVSRLTDALAPVRLLDHPFYVAWSEGKLAADDLRFYAGQYAHVVRAFPDLLAATLPHLADPAHRRAIVENLADEEGLLGASHPELWTRFAEGLGVDRATLAAAPALPETTQALATLRHLAAAGSVEALACLWAVESQAPEVSAEKLRGLKAFYNIESAAATEYFRVHAELDLEHSAEEARILETLAVGEETRAEKAAVEAARALREVLDGVVRARGIAC